MAYRMAHINIAPPSSLDQSAVYPYYPTRFLNMTTLPSELPLGSYWELQGNGKDGGGNGFAVVRASDTDTGFIAGGMMVQPRKATPLSYGTSVDGSTNTSLLLTNSATSTAVTLTVDDIGKPLYIVGETGYYIRIISSIGPEVNRAHFAAINADVPITLNGTYMNDADAITVPASWSPGCGIGSLLHPYEVEKADGTTEPCGVVLGTSVTDSNYTILHVSGVGLVSTHFYVGGVYAPGDLFYAGANGYAVQNPETTVSTTASLSYPFPDYLGATSDPRSVTGVTAASPPVVTCVGHGFRSGERVTVSGVTGMSGANGTSRITVIDVDSFSRDFKTASGTFGGTAVAVGQRYDYPRTVTAASNTTPITITCPNHNLPTGTVVSIADVVGNTGANGTWSIVSVTTDTFTLTGTVGNGAYSSGGAIRPLYIDNTAYLLRLTRLIAIPLVCQAAGTAILSDTLQLPYVFNFAKAL
jgi:hypothetical protein